MDIKEELDKRTGSKYSAMRLQDIYANADSKQLKFVFAAPYEFCNNTLNGIAKEEITDIISQVCKANGIEFSVSCDFKKIYYNEEIISHVVLQFLQKNYNAFCSQIPDNSIKVLTTDDKINVDISLPDYMYAAFSSNGICQAIKAHIDDNYCTDANIKLINLGDIAKDINFKPAIQMQEVKKYYHDVSKTSALLGDTVVSKATYIAKSPKRGREICLAGTVTNLTTKTSKKGYFYHTFVLDDTTGKVECIKFTRSKKRGVLGAISDGAQVIVMGEYPEEDGFGSNKLIINSLSTCEINYDAIDLSEPVALKEHKAIQIIPYNDNFDNLMQMSTARSETIMGKSYVALDFETTGLDTSTCDVIEIGLAKMVDGKVTEYFDTYVDPKKHIPEESTRIHGIVDSDVKDAPYIEDALPEMFKFIGDCPIITQNGFGYDFIILDRLCDEYGYPRLTNQRLDTLLLADEYRVPGRHNLGVLCNYFGITLINAHRAYADCIATAKVYAALEDYHLSK